MLELGKKLALEGRIEALEFATYFLNRESIAMARKTGFHLRAKFFVLGGARSRDFEPEEPERVEPTLEDLPSASFRSAGGS